MQSNGIVASTLWIGGIAKASRAGRHNAWLARDQLQLLEVPASSWEHYFLKQWEVMRVGSCLLQWYCQCWAHSLDEGKIFARKELRQKMSCWSWCIWNEKITMNMLLEAVPGSSPHLSASPSPMAASWCLEMIYALVGLPSILSKASGSFIDVWLSPLSMSPLLS